MNSLPAQFKHLLEWKVLKNMKIVNSSSKYYYIEFQNTNQMVNVKHLFNIIDYAIMAKRMQYEIDIFY